MRRIGLLAAALCLLALASTFVGTGEAAGHTCGAADRDFIRTASIDFIALPSLTADVAGGDADGIAQEASDAAQRVTRVKPRDRSLRTAQRYLGAMFTEYGQAVRLQSRGKDAGERVYRAYLLANSAHDVLAEAQPELLAKGCDVGPLL